MKESLRNYDISFISPGSGIPVLALHGWGVDHRLMSGCLEPVFENCVTGYKRLYPDLPGMGRTKGHADISGSQDVLDILLEFIEREIGAESFLLAGESWGGYLARGILRAMPSRILGLLLIAPAFRPWRTTPEGIDKGDVPEHKVIFSDREYWETLSEEERSDFEFMGVRLTRDAHACFKRDVLCGIRLADQKFLSECLSREQEFAFDPDDLEAPFDRPGLVICGRQDASVGYKGMLGVMEKYPRTAFTVLDGCGHNLQTEKPEVVELLVGDWLSRVSEYGKDLFSKQ